MNHAVFTRWLSQPLWLRMTIYLLAAIVSLSAIWLLRAQPVSRQTIAIAGRTQAEIKRYQVIKQKLFAEGAFAETQAAIDRLQKTLASTDEEPFSLLTLLDKTGGELIVWLPEKEGGTLTLKLSWPQTLSMFNYFRALPAAVALAQFTLSREGDELLFQSRLELNHEQ